MGKISVRPSVIIFEREKLLVVKSRYPEGDYYLLPGGGIEGDETITDCAVREAFEETGLSIKIVKLAFVNDYITKDGRCLNIFLYGKLLDGSRIKDANSAKDNGKIVAVEWRSLDELESLNFKPEILLTKLKGNKAFKDIEDIYFKTS